MVNRRRGFVLFPLEQRGKVRAGFANEVSHIIEQCRRLQICSWTSGTLRPSLTACKWE